ncbi:MAG TPA: polymer-forming cytoskeletal protein [Gemmatimonadales bacterium]|nr:polymer-forming cytoskeletal protein [Gemmatimonadales bacterium]
MALPAAIYTLVVVGGLVSAAFCVSVLEQRLGLNSLKVNAAFAVADGGVAEVIGQWSGAGYNRLALGQSASLPQRWVGESGWYRGTVRRLTQQLFFIAIEAYSPDSAARQGAGVLARLKPLEFDPRAALTVTGSVHLGTSTSASGNDEPPAGWTDCPGVTAPMAGLRLPPADSTTIVNEGCPGYECLSGSPKILADSTVTTEPLATGGLSQLSLLANKTLPGGSYTEIGTGATGGETCDVAAAENWGNPPAVGGPCGAYFPFIFIGGNATVSGNGGQGVLVVDGDLEVDGGFHFAGVVIVAGTLSMTGAGGRVTGAVYASGASLRPGSVLGSATVTYSSCALHKALTATAGAVPLDERAWVSVY